ncbi:MULTISPECIES: hypothetical protein [Paraburkholderia]|uniref:Uncharacterized protein n=1 Tax=Paraburkholderia madseniana TaxID=2599607 RepID=A0A6N6WHV4_9BURK|nr:MULTISPECIES: hypothetical protein [Paraburkholderia]KAE8759020.1 hypothetical protein FSO04_15665 [Paraburkholderia madseniana]MCX4171291.1 hypothetical protein [Paraburkholderia madseniana]MDQ6459302.1 hypothetical protein [Paraburkholderia madseniana]
MRTTTRHPVRLLSDIKRAHECRTLRAVVTRNTMRLATEEAAAESASPKDIRRDETRRSSAEIYLLPGSETGSRLH